MRFTPGCKCCTCLWTIRVQGCLNSMLPGALVSLSQGGVEIANCTSTGKVASVTRVNTGSNYDSVPTVGFTGGGSGSGATAVADMQIGTITRTAGGSGYTDGVYPGLGTFDGGGGSGGTFTFSVSGGVVQPSIPIVTRGQGYTSPPTPNFSAAGPGTGAAATVKLNVRALILTGGGTNYTAIPTVTITGGGATGLGVASGTATIAALCTLEVPAGNYDMTITPPEDSGYAVRSLPVTASCGSTTTFTLLPDDDHTCGSTCGYGCSILPKSAHLTWSYDEDYDQFDHLGNPIFVVKYPDATLTLGPSFPQYGGAPAYWSEPFDLDVGPATVGGPHQFLTARYVIACLGPSINWIYQNEDGTWSNITNYAGGPGASLNPANRTCVPFFVTGGTGNCHSGTICSRWEYHG